MRVLDTLRAYESDRREIRARDARANHSPIIHRGKEPSPRARGRGGGRGGGVGTYQLRDVIVSRGGERLRDLRGEGCGAGWVSEAPGLAGKNEVDGRFVHAEATWKRSSGHAPPRRPRRTPGRSARRLSCAARGRAAACAPRAETRPRPSDDAPRSASGGETRACLPSLLGTRAHTRPTPKRSNRFLRTDYLVTKKTKNHHISREFKLPVETACVAPSEGAP